MPVVFILRGVLRCLQACGYFCQAAACTVETCQTIWQTFTTICTCGQGWKGMLYNFTTMFTSEEDPDIDKDFDLPVVTTREFTDLPALLIFITLLASMAYGMNRSLAYGRPEVFINGVDSWTNVCGNEFNQPYPDIPDSGRNMTEFPMVLLSEFIRDPSQISLYKTIDMYTYLCIRSCPSAQASFSCEDYLRDNSPYGPTLITTLCPRTTSKSLPNFNTINGRCVPSGILENTTVRLRNSLLNFYSNNWLNNLVHDCYAARAELTWLVLISLAFSFVFLVIVHGAAIALCWYSYTIFFLVGTATAVYLWYLYFRINGFNSGISLFSDSGVGDFQETGGGSQSQTSYSDTLFIISILATVTVSIFTLAIILTGSRNKDACSVLFEAGISCTVGLKWVYLLPFTTLALVALALGLWVYTLTYLTAILEDQPQVFLSSIGIVQGLYVPDASYINLLLAFEVLTIFWVIHFLVGCQSLLIDLTIGTYYFTIRKDDMYRPMRVAISRLIRRHLGSAAAGGFLIGFFGLLKAPLSFVQARVLTSTHRVLKAEAELDTESDTNSFYSPTPSAGVQPHKHMDYAFFHPSGDRHRHKRHGDRRRWATEAPIQATKKRTFATEQELKPEVDQEQSVADSRSAVNAWLVVNKCCTPCFWALDNVFSYNSDLNYAVIALEGFWFLHGGRWLRDRLEVEQRLKGIIPISSFVLFLEKLTVTLVILPIGFLLLKDKEEVFLYGYPLAVSVIICFIIAHVFFSLFEAATGAVFVCYIEDTFHNDGDLAHPYFGDKFFFENFENALEEIDLEEAPLYTKVHVDDIDEETGTQALRKSARRPKDVERQSDSLHRASEDKRWSKHRKSTIIQQPRRSSARRSQAVKDETPESFTPSSEEERDAGGRSSVFPFDPVGYFDKLKSNLKLKPDDDFSTDEDENGLDVDELFEQAEESLEDRNNKKQKRESQKQKDKQKQDKREKRDAEKSKKDKNQEAKQKDNKGDGKSKQVKKDQTKKEVKKPSDKTAKKVDTGKGKRDGNVPKKKPPARPPPPKTPPKTPPARPPPPKTPPKTPPARPPPPKTPPKKLPARPPPPKTPPKKLPARPPPPKTPPKTRPARPPPPKTPPKKPPARPPKPKLASPKAPKPPPRPKRAAAKAGKVKLPGTKKLKSPKLNAKVGKSKIPKFRKGPKSPNIGTNLKRPNIGRLPRAGGGIKGTFRGGGGVGASDAVGGAMGAVNIADGLLRITGKKKEAQEAADNVAHGTRNRSKATNLMSHIIDNRWKEHEDQSGPWYNPKAFRSWKMHKDLIFGGKKILEDTDKAWDEKEAIDEAEEEEESEEEDEPRRRRRRARRSNRV